MNNLSNSVRLTGRLGAVPEMRELDDDKKVAKISLATNYYKKNGKGETVQEAHWHELILWNRQAEIAEQYLDKGSQIAIECRLANRYYTDAAGAKHDVTEVIVSEMMMLDKREN